ncbi:MAG TPA: hypothetical protein VGO57_00020 [Verrucomicrobiae bacterium]|jgi:hypothetical protein
MESNWAEENLQTIRTLMERSAVYRRALAPIMLFAGVLGLIAAGLGLGGHLDSMRAFSFLWLGTALAAVGGAFLIARRQALKDRELFWSPPTRRVAQALLPAFTAGTVVSALFIIGADSANFTALLAFFWILFYGCAIHSAGFFMPRGMKLLGWIFIAGSSGFFGVLVVRHASLDLNAHWLMGIFFGALQFIYGAYLYLTEKKIPAA